jgi:hypothetical protein
MSDTGVLTAERREDALIRANRAAVLAAAAVRVDFIVAVLPNDLARHADASNNKNGRE